MTAGHRAAGRIIHPRPLILPRLPRRFLPEGCHRRPFAFGLKTLWEDTTVQKTLQFLHEAHPSGKFCTKLCLDVATATDARITLMTHGCGAPQVLHLHRIEGLHRTLTSRCPVQHNLFVDLAEVQKVLSQGVLLTTKT